MTTPMTTEEYKEWCEAHGEWPPEQEVLSRLPAENRMLRAKVEQLQFLLDTEPTKKKTK
jgi:hypothetical protein